MSVTRSQGKRGVGHLAGDKPSGVLLNRKDLRSVREVTLDNYDAESMYLRENELTQFDVDVKMDYLRVLDLSINDIGGAVDFLDKTPHLHHLYMTGNKVETLMGISNFNALETLCLSDNAISSFEGLENLKNLRVLSLNFNNISSFEFYPTLPSLHTLNLVGNPITEVPSYRSMAVAINCNTLVSIDGNPVQEEERAAVEHYEGKIAHCIRQGFVVEGENIEEAADAFLLKAQRELEKSKPLQLRAIRLAVPVEEGEDEAAGKVLLEGMPVTLSLCMQDIRSYTDRTTDVFHSRYLYPVIFQVSGEATEVFVVGSMNNWTDPIELERCEKDGEIYFHTTLYLPAGDYEYRYIVDGVEKVSDTNSITSKYKQGACNLYQVTEQEPQSKDQDTILHIRWMRSNPGGVFEVIAGQNSLEYLSSIEDIGCCLRAEVLAYIRGEFSFLYFDVSSPILAAPPSCTQLELKGNAVESGILRAEAQYHGGIEGASTLQWYRVAESGEESMIDLDDPWAGYQITREDVGFRIRVEFTPRRDDWVTGEPRSEVTEPVQPGPPNCESIKIIGNLVEGSQLEVEVEYSGGEEGDSFYQWLRRVNGTREEYVPIEGENDTKYVASNEDCGRFLAVEYTPVNSAGKEGETCRCVLESKIEATNPQINDLRIVGELFEQHTLTLHYRYNGGRAGAHMIQWYRRDPQTQQLVKVGQPNSNSLALSRKEIGSSIEVAITPVRADGATGEQASAKTDDAIAAVDPELKSMTLAGDAAPGNELYVQVEYVGGQEGKPVIVWEIENPRTHYFDVIERGPRHLYISQHEAGKTLRVTYTPVRSDGAEGEPRSCTTHISGELHTPLSTKEAEQHYDPTQDSTASRNVVADANEQIFAPAGENAKHSPSANSRGQERSAAAKAATPAEDEQSESDVEEEKDDEEEVKAPAAAQGPVVPATERAGNVAARESDLDSDEDHPAQKPPATEESSEETSEEESTTTSKATPQNNGALKNKLGGKGRAHDSDEDSEL